MRPLLFFNWRSSIISRNGINQLVVWIDSYGHRLFIHGNGELVHDISEFPFFEIEHGFVSFLIHTKYAHIYPVVERERFYRPAATLNFYSKTISRFIFVDTFTRFTGPVCCSLKCQINIVGSAVNFGKISLLYSVIVQRNRFKHISNKVLHGIGCSLFQVFEQFKRGSVGWLLEGNIIDVVAQSGIEPILADVVTQCIEYQRSFIVMNVLLILIVNQRHFLSNFTCSPNQITVECIFQESAHLMDTILLFKYFKSAVFR